MHSDKQLGPRGPVGVQVITGANLAGGSSSEVPLRSSWSTISNANFVAAHACLCAERVSSAQVHVSVLGQPNRQPYFILIAIDLP